MQIRGEAAGGEDVAAAVHCAGALVADVGPVVPEDVVAERGVGRRGLVRRVEIALWDRHAFAVVECDDVALDRGVVGL